MKPHRQIRHSKRVSSETGVAIMDGPATPSRYQQAMAEITIALKQLPPDQRRTLVAEIVTDVIGINTQPTIRPEVRWFAKRMEAKLRANDHKQHWSKLHKDYLIERLFQEANELWLAIRNGESAENIIQEAADVANFAMMIADNAEVQR